MVANDPAARPTMDRVVKHFEELLSTRSTWKLRARPIRRSDSGAINFAKGVWHAYRTTTFVVRGMKPLPTPCS